MQGTTIEADNCEVENSEARLIGPSTDTTVNHGTTATLTNGLTIADCASDATARFDALIKERDALRVEVTHLRRSIEGLQAKHQSEVSGVQERLQEAQREKENAEEQYQNLLGKVNTIRSQLGERLKADAVRYLAQNLHF